jgi:hypothetical protein
VQLGNFIGEGSFEQIAIEQAAFTADEFAHVFLAEHFIADGCAFFGERGGGDAGALGGRDFDALPCVRVVVLKSQRSPSLVSSIARITNRPAHLRGASSTISKDTLE